MKDGKRLDNGKGGKMMIKRVKRMIRMKREKRTIRMKEEKRMIRIKGWCRYCYMDALLGR